MSLDTKHDSNRFICEPEKHIVAATNAIKECRCEVKIKYLTKQERDTFDVPKGNEMAAWLEYKVCRAVTRSETGDLALLLMRLVFTWKGDGSAKTRFVLRRYQVDTWTAIETASPTPCPRARQLFLTVCARLPLNVYKGDAKAAFLQGDLSDSAMFATLAPELNKAPKMSQTEVVRFTKCFSGLVDSPRP